MIRLGYFGDGPWAHNSFKKIINDKSLEIAFVTVRYDHRDSVLLSLAEQYGIPVEISNDINSEEFLCRISKYKVDLFVSMSFNQIFKKKTIEFPRLSSINCHAGKLPFYRGRNILNWVLINDEKEWGITVHYIDEGIDTGDIILQRTFPISDNDDYCTLLNKAHTECAEILYEAIKKIQLGSVERISQKEIDPVGLYCGIRTIGDEFINWNQSSRTIFNFVRAICKPGPQATSHIYDKIIKINHVREIKNSRPYIGFPGQVIGKTKEGFYVKTKDTFLEVIDFDFDGKIRVGDRLI